MITAALTFLTFARIVVCLVEAYVAVRSERLADEGLMQMCNDPTQQAAAAPDFRTLCLRKRAERAAPIVLKAVLRAVTTAFSEFCEVFSSPSRVALLVLFSITGIAAPVVKACAALFVQNLKKRRMRQRGAKYVTSDSEESDDATATADTTRWSRSPPDTPTTRASGWGSRCAAECSALSRRK